MSNGPGTPGGVGSSQGGQAGWEDGNQNQPIPPSREGTTSAGMTGTVYDPSKETVMATKTDKEKADEAEAKAKADKGAEGRQATTAEQEANPEVSLDSTDPADQPNFGLPEGVSTSQTRGETDVEDAGEPKEVPNPTVEEQLAGSGEFEEKHPEA